MKLAPKTLIVVVAVVLGMAVGTHLLVSRLVVKQLLAVEERETTDRALVAAGVLRQQAEEFRVLSQDWAVWTEMVDFARSPTPEFSEQNMKIDSFDLKRWHHMAIVRSVDHGVAWSSERVDAKTLGPASRSFLELAKRLAVPPEQEAPSDGFVRIDGSLFIVASQPLRNADGQPGHTRGAMVYTLKMDEPWMKKARELTRLDLRIESLTGSSASPIAAEVSALPPGHQVLLRERDESTLATYTLLRDIDGEPLAIVEILHPRPNFAAAREMQRALSIAIALGAGLLGLVAYALVHFGLLRRIRELAALVHGMKTHGARASVAPAVSRSGDELSVLAERVRSLSHVLAEREGNLRVAEDLARSVLNNVDEGLVLCDATGEIISEVSTSAIVWFGEAKGKIWSYIGDEREGWKLEFGLEQLTSGFLPVELALTQLPSTFHRAGDTFSARYQPLMAEEAVAGLLIVIERVTERVALAKSEAIATELCQVLRHAIDEPQEFRAFVRDAEALLMDIDDAPDGANRLRAIHTLKGNAACFGMRSVAEAAHGLEDQLADEPDSFALHATRLREAWNEAMGRVRSEIDLDDDALTVPASEYEAVARLIADSQRASQRPATTPSEAPCA